MGGAGACWLITLTGTMYLTTYPALLRQQRIIFLRTCSPLVPSKGPGRMYAAWSGLSTPRPGGADRGRDEGSLSYFILPHACASPPSSCGMPCGHLPRTLRGLFGKQPYPEHRALRPGGRGIARARCAASASRTSQSPALT